jgi:hypothetical protein
MLSFPFFETALQPFEASPNRYAAFGYRDEEEEEEETVVEQPPEKRMKPVLHHVNSNSDLSSAFHGDRSHHFNPG